jgi:putative FmdB family regulatory protein
MATTEGASYTGSAMPIYQYDCAGCDRRVDVFFRSANSPTDPACPECGSAELSRVMSAFSRARSSSDRVASIDFDQEMGRLRGGDEGDFAKWAKRMGREYDGELGSNFGELAEKAESGEDPIERVDPGFKLQHEINKTKKKSGHSHDGGG